jgi:hypothetical protein
MKENSQLTQKIMSIVNQVKVRSSASLFETDRSNITKPT